MAIYISGSLAYDRVMNFHGSFSDYILPDKIHMLNVCFPIGNLEEKRGGTGGNIAYNLALLGEKSIILASVGKDFASYRQFLESTGLSLEGINTVNDEFTAGAYITTDQHANQITGFHAAAMKEPCGYKFPAIDPKNDLAIIAPSTTIDMSGHATFYKEKGLPYIFDPGQQITALSQAELLNGLSGAEILIGNDYEMELISKLTGLSFEDLLERSTHIITTLGEKGSRISSKGQKTIDIPPAPISRLEDPTGAGDSYRAGLLKGLKEGLSLEESARLGTVCAAFCVECYGTQEHYYSEQSLGQRYQEAFKQKLPVSFTPLLKKGA